MASTWSNLKVQLMGAGDESGTWGTVTNANLGTVLEEAIAGTANVTFSGADVTLTLTNSTASQSARNMRLNLTGTSGGARNLIVPAIEKMYVVNNGLADTVTVKNSSGTGVAIPSGKSTLVFNNGTDVLDAITTLSSLTLGAALAAGSGGTGVTSPGTAGNVLTSTGSAWASTSPGAYIPSGGIIMWSGSIASIPAGWYLCNGSNGTPDLRDKFVVGAGSTYAVAATGGSANAIVVAHTHTATTDSGGTNGTVSIRGGGGGEARMFGSASGAFSFSGSATTKRFDESSGSYTTYDTLTYTAAHTHTLTTASSGSSGTNANLPPYYALAYIMKA